VDYIVLSWATVIEDVLKNNYYWHFLTKSKFRRKFSSVLAFCGFRERRGGASLVRLLLISRESRDSTTRTSSPFNRIRRIREWRLTRVRYSDEQLPGGRSAGRIPAGVAARGRRPRWAAGSVFPGGQFTGPDWHVQLERRRRSSSRSRGFRSRKLRPGRS